MKLALVISAIAVIAGAFSLGYKAGSNKEKVIIQEKIIHAAKRHTQINQEQAKHVATRGQRLHIDSLRKGEF